MVRFMKRYKKYQLLFTINLFFMILFILFFIIICIKKYNEYTKINGIYILDNIVQIVITTDELRQIQKNNYVYLNSKRKKIDIITITKNVYNRNRINYHQVLIKLESVDEKTILNISIFQQKRKVIELFWTCWKEE